MEPGAQLQVGVDAGGDHLHEADVDQGWKRVCSLQSPERMDGELNAALLLYRSWCSPAFAGTSGNAAWSPSTTSPSASGTVRSQQVNHVASTDHCGSTSPPVEERGTAGTLDPVAQTKQIFMHFNHDRSEWPDDTAVIY